MQSIPVTILGGSDRKPGALPPSGEGLHSLATYKGVAIRVRGRPLIEILVERLTAAEGFGPVCIAGPARVYEPLGLDARILDTDGSVGVNLRLAIESGERSADGMLGILACDVLPTVRELEMLRARFEDARPCALWCPFVPLSEDPERLGAFAWKPSYRIVPHGASEAVKILPGHLGIFDPGTLRLPLLYRLLDANYRARNRSVATRRATLLRAVFGSLVKRDLKLLLRLRAPLRTAIVVSCGLRLARLVRSGNLEQAELERLIGRVFLRSRVPHERGMRFPILDVLSLAKDIDTEEEAADLVHELEDQDEVSGR
jgi:hypothetical protein